MNVAETNIYKQTKNLAANAAVLGVYDTPYNNVRAIIFGLQMTKYSVRVSNKW